MGVPKTGAGGPPLALALDVVTVPVLTQIKNQFFAPSYLGAARGGDVCQLLSLQSRNTEVFENRLQNTANFEITPMRNQN